MRYRLLSISLVAGLMLFGLVGGGLLGQAQAEQESIKIGMAISITGKYDVLGTRNLQGAQLWASWVNEQGGIYVAELGRKLPVEIIYYDDKSDKDTVIRLVEKLIVEDGADFIIGPYGSSLNIAAAAVTERYGKLMLIHSGASDRIWQQGYRYVVGVLTPSSYYYKSTMEMMDQLDPRPNRIALITEDNPFNLSIRDGIKRWAEELGFEIVFDEVYPQNPTDLSPILTQVKGLNPDAILTASHFRDGALLARQAAELGVRPKFFALGSAPSTVEWWDAVGPDGAQYTVATSQWEPIGAPHFWEHENWYGPMITGQEYNEWFRSVYGADTDFRGAQSFAAGLVLQWAIERCGCLDTDKIRQALGEADLMTFYGHFKIDETGIQIGHEMVVAQWQDGQKMVVWPPALAQAQLVYPRP